VKTWHCFELLKVTVSKSPGGNTIRRNPCQTKGGAVNEMPERPLMTMVMVFNVAGEVPLWFRMLVVMATFARLRWGELIALERGDIDLDLCTIRVIRSVVELDDGAIVIGPPTPEAGVRTVSFPELLKPDLEQRLADFVPGAAESRVFTSWKGGTLCGANFQKIWSEARGALDCSRRDDLPAQRPDGHGYPRRVSRSGVPACLVPL